VFASYNLSVETSAPTPRLAGRRQLKRERVRAELAGAALRLFVENGFENTTVDDIVAQTRVSRRSFFRYFPAKEDVVVYWLANVAAELHDDVVRRPAGEPPLRAAQNAIRAMQERWERDQSRSIAVAQLLQKTPALQARYVGSAQTISQRALASGLAARLGVASDALIPRVIAGVVYALAMIAVDRWASSEGSSLVEALDEAFEAAAEQLSVAAQGAR